MQTPNEVIKVAEAAYTAIIGGKSVEQTTNIHPIFDMATKNQELIFDSLGDSNTCALLEFIKRCDLKHPDLPNLYKSALADFLVQYTIAYDLLTTNKCEDVRKVTKGTVMQSAEVKEFFRSLTGNACIRLVKDAALRSHLRADVGGSQAVDISALSKMSWEWWESIDPSFGHFVRNSDDYKNNLQTLKARQKSLGSLGYTDMASKVSAKVREYESLFLDSYLGFYRVTVRDISAMLAKANKFKAGVHRSTYFSPADIFLNTNGMNHHFVPTFHSPGFFKKIPDRVGKILTHLDEFPDIGGKPVFDRFVVLCSGTGDYAMDVNLINEHVIHPILLGERNKQCYFITYWA